MLRAHCVTPELDPQSCSEHNARTFTRCEKAWCALLQWEHTKVLKATHTFWCPSFASAPQFTHARFESFLRSFSSCFSMLLSAMAWMMKKGFMHSDNAVRDASQRSGSTARQRRLAIGEAMLIYQLVALKRPSRRCSAAGLLASTFVHKTLAMTSNVAPGALSAELSPLWPPTCQSTQRLGLDSHDRSPVTEGVTAAAIAPCIPWLKVMPRAAVVGAAVTVYYWSCAALRAKYCCSNFRIAAIIAVRTKCSLVGIEKGSRASSQSPADGESPAQWQALRRMQGLQ